MRKIFTYENRFHSIAKKRKKEKTVYKILVDVFSIRVLLLCNSYIVKHKKFVFFFNFSLLKEKKKSGSR